METELAEELGFNTDKWEVYPGDSNVVGILPGAASTVIFGPGKMEDAHAVNEKVEIQQLLDFTKDLAVFIAEWCNTQKVGQE